MALSPLKWKDVQRASTSLLTCHQLWVMAPPGMQLHLRYTPPRLLQFQSFRITGDQFFFGSPHCSPESQ